MSTSPDAFGAEVRALALATARDLEATQYQIDFWDGIYQQVLEVWADTRGLVALVLCIGGPHVELHLGGGSPRVVVSWAGEEHSCPVRLDYELVETELAPLWNEAIARAMSNPPHGG